MSILENDIVKLRALEPNDIELLFEWENDSNVWAVTNTLMPISRLILEKYIEDATQDIFTSRQVRLMIDSKLNDENQHIKTVGAVDLFDFDPLHFRAEIGVLIYEKEQRKKYFATEALKIVFRYAFQTLMIHQLYCSIAEDNEVSVHLFQNLGFQIVGKKLDWLRTPNGWKNEYLLQKINSKN